MDDTGGFPKLFEHGLWAEPGAGADLEGLIVGEEEKCVNAGGYYLD